MTSSEGNVMQHNVVVLTCVNLFTFLLMCQTRHNFFISLGDCSCHLSNCTIYFELKLCGL
jgi:hypothetical protein